MTIVEIIGGIHQLRKELAEFRRSSSFGETLRDAKLKTWTKRAFEQLKGWGFAAEAEEGFGPHSVTNYYDTLDSRAGQRDDRLRALRDDLVSHPDHYKSKLALGRQSESVPSNRVAVTPHKVFLGHGRSKLWMRVQMFLKDDLALAVEAWETEPRAGFHSIEVLKKALHSSTFAVMIVTGEDATADGGVRARQNVVHEIGLFQGCLGFEKVALLQQDKVEEFSNLAGLQVIKFSGEEIQSSFYDLQRMLKREGFVK